VATGHEDPTKPNSSMEWELLGKDRSTLVFLMGVRNLELIAKRLVEHGRARDTPCALIENGTTRAQRTILGTLGEIAEKARRLKARPPAVLVVGEVVRLAGKLRWYRGGRVVA